MITPLRCVSTAALGAMLVLAGCTSSHVIGHRAVGMRTVGPVLTLTIVESSPNFRAEAQDLAGMRNEVVKYLASQGLDRSGDYYVRIDLQPKNPGDPAEWAIVKLTNSNTSTYTLLSANTAIGPDDYYPYSYAYGSSYYDSYNYWGPELGYYGPTYVDPVFYRPVPRRHDGDRDNDHRPGGGDRDHNANDHPRGTGDHQPKDHARNGNGRDHDGDRGGRNDGGNNWRDHRPDRPDATSRPTGNDRPRWSGGGGTRPESAPQSSGGGYSRSSPSPSYTPPSRESSPAPSYSAPSYSPPAVSSAPAHNDPSPTRNDRNQER